MRSWGWLGLCLGMVLVSSSATAESQELCLQQLAFVNMSRVKQYYPYERVLDVEKGHEATHLSFAEQTVRQGFVRKVFGILAAQLLTTFGVACAVVTLPGVKPFLQTNPWILFTCMITTMVVMLVFAFSEQTRRQHPTNLILLTVFTVAESLLVGAICASYRPEIVLLALGITAFITIGLGVYALTTKEDFTTAGGFLYCALLTLVAVSFVGLVFRPPWMNLAMGSAGALLFSAYLVYDVQMLMGGEHKFSLSPDEYIFGAVAIYLDIINIFLHILRILSSSDRG